MSAGAWVGIGIAIFVGVVLLIVIVVLIIIFCLKRSRVQQKGTILSIFKNVIRVSYGGWGSMQNFEVDIISSIIGPKKLPEAPSEHMHFLGRISHVP